MKKFALICLTGLIMFTSCEEEEDSKLSPQQSSAVQDQSTSDAYFNDANDLSATAYNSPSQSNLSGRTHSGGKIELTFTVTGDTRFNGAIVTLTTSDNNSILNPQGSIVINFGTGQTDPSGTQRKGKILIAYSGLRFVPSSYYTITFDGYEVNGVKVQGKRTVTTTSFTNTGISFNVKDEDGKVTFTDGTMVTRAANQTLTYVLPTASSKGQWQVLGMANGMTRDGKTYALVINTALVFKVECALSKIFIPSEGEAVLTVDSVPITLNYGSAGAACDKIVVVTVLGFAQEITVEN